MGEIIFHAPGWTLMQTICVTVLVGAVWTTTVFFVNKLLAKVFK